MGPKSRNHCTLILRLNQPTGVRYDELPYLFEYESLCTVMVMTSRPRELPYRYPEHLRADVQQAPTAPGVYLFLGEDERVPLYIGKSINLRARLNSHLRNKSEARLLHQTRSIIFHCTAGEISALLLEARLIKQQQPLFNRRLRRQGTLSSIVVDDMGKVQVVAARQLNYGRDPHLYGLFRHQKKARDVLLALADEHQLCLGVMGLDTLIRQRGCFRASIGKCRGACQGKESLEAHRERLLAALSEYHVALWPYAGPVALREHYQELTAIHVLDHWRYMGSFDTLDQARRGPWRVDDHFDADVYKITVTPLLSEHADIVPLST